ncbi:MAG TPA: CoA ester lyase [Amycolatopsis sp.]|nr:CoA ester lyase [Amycolatopsis sp.]
MPEAEQLAEARTLLFVPGDRPERFAKAAASGADAIVIDLEDAVAPPDKDAALRNARAWLAEGHDAVIRLNPAESPWYRTEVAALCERPVAVVLPKAAGAEAVAGLVERLAAGSVVIPLIETAAGVLDARAVCSVPGVVRAAFGHVDLSAELGVPPETSATLAHARVAVVLAAAAAGCAPPLDGVTTALDAPDVLNADVRRAADLGFTGKLCVHPRQIAVVHQGFAPSADELAWAERVVAAAAGQGATAVDGQMIDRPVVDRARRLLGRRDKSTFRSSVD